jgi:PAP2 superfamily
MSSNRGGNPVVNLVHGDVRALGRRLSENMLTAFQPLLRWRPGFRDAAELLLVASALPLYYLVRGLAHQRVDEAVNRGVAIVNFERSLGIFWEVQLQSWILPYDWLVTFLNGFYLYGHLPIIGVLAIWMYFWHRPQYLLMRNAFLISGAIGLIIFVNFPTAPPRLLEAHGVSMGFVDTIFQEYNKSRPDTPSFFVNEYAAMPSLHIGWNLLVGIALWMATKNPFARAFAVLMPIIMFAVIVLTANHYIVDAFAGLGVMLLGLTIAVTGRWVVLRILSPNSRIAREKGWVPWIYWLCGVADREQAHQAPEKLGV